MMLTCRQIAEQISDNIDQPSNGLNWLKFKLHLLMCVYCRRYKKQMDLTVNTVGLIEVKPVPSEEVKTKTLEQFKRHHKDCVCDKTSQDESI